MLLEKKKEYFVNLYLCSY